MRKRWVGVLLCATLSLWGCGRSGDGPPAPVPPFPASGLPLPSSMSERDFEKVLYDFLNGYRYRGLGWAKDKRIRDTGPYQDGTYYGTHPAVKIYYSPEVMAWLQGGRQGEIPDGAMMIKEMYPPPAPRYAGKPEPLPTQWTVMVRDKAGSVDGWFWSYYGNSPTPQPVDNDDYPFEYPNSGFGLYCVRCHGSADSLLTFASTDNIEGFPGEPIAYEVDNSWQTDTEPDPVTHPNEREIKALAKYVALKGEPAHDFVNSDWLAQYPQFPAGKTADIEHLRPVSATKVVAQKHRQFMTSDQCLSCHSGDNSPFGPNLIKDQFDVSPHSEWQWSMMGLAGRDPIFYAQLETESALYAKPGTELTPEQIQNLCLHCHGVMGQRQFTEDHPGELYTLEKSRRPENHHYGDLSLDGVSCTVCHQMSDPTNDNLLQTRTGDFKLASKTGDGQMPIFGPFANPATLPMSQSLAALPLEGKHMQGSKLCASCHTVYLPVLDTGGKVLDHKYEQSTYLEWVNSNFRDGASQAQSCQECHMPDTYHGTIDPPKIANVQDQDFPETDHQADVQVPQRAGYRRHQLVGANAFAMQMFQSFPDILGVRLKSFMTGFDNGLQEAIRGAEDSARHQSARVEILNPQRVGDQLTVQIKSTNLTGHRFPSGVGFRRVFLEFLVEDGSGQVVWGSGRSNSLGILVDQNGTALPSEFHDGGAFQDHHQQITAQDQAQIYEELTKDSEGNFSTSFLARVDEVKDNRFMPQGWTFNGPPGFEPEFAHATAPIGTAAADADFIDGTGSDIVTYQAQLPPGTSAPLKIRATLYYQAIPPRYLADRFNQAKGPGTRRLHFLTSHLDDSKTGFPGWKLPAGQAEVSLP